MVATMVMGPGKMNLSLQGIWVAIFLHHKFFFVFPIRNEDTTQGDAMNKFDLIVDPVGMPTRINALPELQIPERFNVARALFQRIERAGWDER